MKKLILKTNMILVIATLQLLLTSCCNYYKAISSPLKNNAVKAVKIDSLNLANRTLILRNGENAYFISNPFISADQETMECNLEILESSHKLHLTKGINGKMRYKKSNPAYFSVLNEAHIYITPDSTAALGKQRIALDKVQKIEVIEKDKQRTTTSYVLGGLGITAGVFAIGALIAGLALSSMTFTMQPF